MKRNCQTIPRPCCHRTPRTIKNIQSYFTRLLVARNVPVYSKLCGRMCHMPVYQNPASNPCSPATKPSSHRDLEVYHNGLHHRPSITMDFVTDLPPSNGYDSMFVVVDRFSKATIISPCRKDITAEETSKLYLANIWQRTGLPQQVILD
jgi:hypothetical protein